VLATPGTGTSGLGEDAGEEETQDMVDEGERSKTQREKERKRRAKAPIVVEHLDIIKDEFWDRRPWLLSDRPAKAGSKAV